MNSNGGDLERWVMVSVTRVRALLEAYSADGTTRPRHSMGRGGATVGLTSKAFCRLLRLAAGGFRRGSSAADCSPCRRPMQVAADLPSQSDRCTPQSFRGAIQAIRTAARSVPLGTLRAIYGCEDSKGMCRSRGATSPTKPNLNVLRTTLRFAQCCAEPVAAVSGDLPSDRARSLATFTILSFCVRPNVSSSPTITAFCPRE
jgi:hypothetical protein